MRKNFRQQLQPRAPDAAQRVALAKRCAAEPGPRLLATRRNRGPGSAKQRFARATRCIAPGTRALIRQRKGLALAVPADLAFDDLAGVRPFKQRAQSAAVNAV